MATVRAHHDGSAVGRPGVGGVFGLGAFAALALLAWFAVVAAFLMIRPFGTPSSSMAPTLEIGDDFFVSKFAYGLTRHSLPLNDLLPSRMDGRAFASGPERGDIAVFKLPSDGTTDYVKRIVGLPGDTVQLVQGVLTLNGKPVARERVADYETSDASGQPIAVPQYREMLPNGAAYNVIEHDGDRGFLDNTGVFTVPPGHVFMLGDNRDNSADSRDLKSVGYVPFENLVGRPLVIYFSMDESGDLRTDRLFTPIR